MKRLNLFLVFVGIFFLAFAVSVVVKLLYSYLVHGNIVYCWQSAIQLGLILAIILTVREYFERKK
jgi:hypothetical protein